MFLTQVQRTLPPLKHPAPIVHVTLLHSSHHSQEQSVKGFTMSKICWNNLQIWGLLFTGAWSLNVFYYSQDQSTNGICYAQELLE